MRAASFSILLLLVSGGCFDLGLKVEDISQVEEVYYYESPEEKVFLDAVSPFYDAMAAGKFEEGYDLLGEYARSDVHPFQFVALEQPVNSQPRIATLSKEQFVEWMQKIVAQYGAPKHLETAYVAETDTEVLSGNSNAFDVSYAIGLMSQTVPTNIRKAAVRGQIRTAFNPQELQSLLADYELTTEDELVEEGIFPYFWLKTVLVQDANGLSIAYFEFVPPSILD